MIGTQRLDRGPGKARSSFLKLLSAATLSALMALGIVGCNSNPTPDDNQTTSGGQANVEGKGDQAAQSGQVTPGPGVDTADDRAGTQVTGG